MTRRSRWLAETGLVVALLEGVVSITAGVVSDLSRHQLMQGFVVSNTVIGLSFALAGYPIARMKPQNVVGWLMLGAGVAYAFSGAGYATLAWGADPDETAVGWRLLADATSIAWPVALGFLIPMTLLHFPDGKLLSRRWRIVPLVALTALICFEAAVALGPRDTTTELQISGYLRWHVIDRVDSLGMVAGVLGYSVYCASMVALIVKYRRGDERQRRQLLWFVLAAGLMVAAFLFNDLFFDSWAGIFVIALPPFAIMVAILRHQLLDIRLVISRSVAYLLLTALVAATYAAIVALTSNSIADRAPLGPPVLATLAIAIGFNPARVFLQERVERIMYGARHDPVRAVGEVGAHLLELDDRPTGLGELLGTICQVLRLPWAAIVVDGSRVALHGQSAGVSHELPLRLGGDTIGELQVGLRRGETRPNKSDERVLALFTGSLAVALRATRYSEELRRARTALVETREEERRRLRRDLHDGLGPRLTGVVLKADAARRMTATNPTEAARLMDELRRETTAAVDDIRRLVNELRPPELDVLGLHGALTERAATMRHRSDGAPITVRVEPFSLPALPASVEVALYRIAVEALNNVARHSTASQATVSLAAEGNRLVLTVTDNGARNGAWRPGVGLTSMAERTAELGGAFEAGGGVVCAAVPFGGGS